MNARILPKKVLEAAAYEPENALLVLCSTVESRATNRAVHHLKLLPGISIDEKSSDSFSLAQTNDRASQRSVNGHGKELKYFRVGFATHI